MPALLPLLWAAALAAPTSVPGALAARCERGAADACREAGRALLAGAPAGARLGVAYVALACEMGDAPACADLGALHALGRGVSFDAGRATALSRRACEAGVGFACANWTVLAVEEAGGLARVAGTPQAAELVRRLRGACDAGAPEGCLDLAVALATGAGGRKDPDAAAASLLRACDAGLALACYRLALAWPGEATAGPLRARACRAAITPACEAAGLPTPPSGAATPSPRLVEDDQSLALAVPGAGGVHAADLAVRAGVAPTISGEAAAADPAVALLLPARRLGFAQCLDVARTRPREAARLTVSFLVEADGRTGDVRVTSEPPEAALEACAADVALAWEFPAGPGRAGPFEAALDLEPFPGGITPGYPGAGGLRPAPRDPACVAAALKLPAGATSRSLTFKLAVDPEGKASLVQALTPAPEPTLAAAAAALRACRWTPGAVAGRPAPVWTTYTVLPTR